MAMDKAIKDFPKQLKFEPSVENAENFELRKKFVVCGMGGSHLAADLIKCARPDLDLKIHSNYGLPQLNDLGERLIIINSYSGNTEETLDSFNTASERGMAVAASSVGGKLLKEAKNKEVAFIKIPDTGIQPRVAVGFSVLALLKLMGEEEEIAKVKKAYDALGAEEPAGKEIADKLSGKIPVIYSSEKNRALALNWKVIFNETGKIPAFYNVFPELNHNEMTGFSAEGGSASGGDAVDSTRTFSQNFAFVFLRDTEDDPRIIKRMDLTEKLLKDRGFEILQSNLIQAIAENRLSVWQKIFSSLLIADWAAYHLALHYGAEPEQVPMVEEFKKLLS